MCLCVYWFVLCVVLFCLLVVLGVLLLLGLVFGAYLIYDVV